MVSIVRCRPASARSDAGNGPSGAYDASGSMPLQFSGAGVAGAATDGDGTGGIWVAA